MKIKEDIEIQIGNHIANSHVFINGVEIAVTELHIALSGDDRIPKVNLLIPVYKGKMLIKVNEAEVTFDELIKYGREKNKSNPKKGTKRV